MTVKLKLLPVCECGHVFHNLYCEPIFFQTEGLRLIYSFQFTPSHCPKCGEPIEDVEYLDRGENQ